MGADDDYRLKLAAFLATQPVAKGVTTEQVLKARTRDELGITSLNMIVVMLNYLKDHTDGSVALRPEWVPRMVDVDGIVAVLREIDASKVAQPQ